MPRDNLTLTVSTRPLRLIFVAQSREDITRAVYLFTHVWGGSSNIILPSSTDDNDALLFERTLRRFDPDVVLYSTKDIPQRDERILGGFPCEIKTITDEEISKHAFGDEYLHLNGGVLSHPGLVLVATHPNGLKESTINLLDSEQIDFDLSLVYGLPTKRFREYLSQRLSGKTLRMPENFLDTCKLVMLASEYATPLALSNTGLIQNYSFDYSSIDAISPLEGSLTIEPMSLYIFLDNDNDMSVPCAFWNIRGRSSIHNKLIFPCHAFIENIVNVFSLLVQIYNFNQIFIIVDKTEGEVHDIYALVMKCLEPKNKGVLVTIYFSGYRHAIPSGKLTYGVPDTSTRVVNEDNSIRFVPRAPLGHDQKDVLFGYECKLKTSRGQTLSLPISPLMSILLLNELDRVQKAKANENNWGKLWLRRTPAIRPRSEGVTGNTTPGMECLFFWHDDETWITETLGNVAIRVIANRHTQYARGFIKKFGGIKKTLSLIRDGGQRIIQALSSHRAEQCGIVAAQIVSYLKDELGMERGGAQTLVAKRLSELLAAGLVRRGFALRCPVCNLKAWYAVNRIDEFVECIGCAEQFQLGNERIEYSYVANELAKRFLKAGGEALLVTASVLLTIESSASIQFGGDLFKDHQTQNFAEIDLILLSKDALILVECKSFGSIQEKELNEVRISTQRAIKAAQLIGAPDIVIGVVAKDNLDRLHPVIKELENEANGIDISLVLNGMFFLHGNDEPLDISKIRFRKSYQYLSPKSIGKIKNSYGLGGRMKAINPARLDGWIKEMQIIDVSQNDSSL